MNTPQPDRRNDTCSPSLASRLSTLKIHSPPAKETSKEIPRENVENMPGVVNRRLHSTNQIFKEPVKQRYATCAKPTSLTVDPPVGPLFSDGECEELDHENDSLIDGGDEPMTDWSENHLRPRPTSTNSDSQVGNGQDSNSVEKSNRLRSKFSASFSDFEGENTMCRFKSMSNLFSQNVAENPYVSENPFVPHRLSAMDSRMSSDWTLQIPVDPIKSEQIPRRQAKRNCSVLNEPLIDQDQAAEDANAGTPKAPASKRRKPGDLRLLATHGSQTRLIDSPQLGQLETDRNSVASPLTDKPRKTKTKSTKWTRVQRPQTSMFGTGLKLTERNVFLDGPATARSSSSLFVSEGLELSDTEPANHVKQREPRPLSHIDTSRQDQKLSCSAQEDRIAQSLLSPDVDNPPPLRRMLRTGSVVGSLYPVPPPRGRSVSHSQQKAVSPSLFPPREQGLLCPPRLSDVYRPREEGEEDVTSQTHRLPRSSPNLFQTPDTNSSSQSVLPFNRGAQAAITPDTLCDVLAGKYKTHYDRLILVDCRYDYEYNGGHICGAVNLQDYEVNEFFFKRYRRVRNLVIFYCEFSSQRGPTCYNSVRAFDRTYNVYPELYYPEIYLLHGGYKQFFTEIYGKYCVPPKYIRMDDPQYEGRLKEMRKMKKIMTARSLKTRTGSSDLGSHPAPQAD